MANINIYGTLHNATGEPIAKAAQVKDENQNKYQSEINANVMAGNRYENGKWIENKAQVEDSLDSDSANDALSARQGKELKTLINELVCELDAANDNISGNATSIGNLDTKLTEAIAALNSAIAKGDTTTISEVNAMLSQSYSTTDAMNEAIAASENKITEAYTKAIQIAITESITGILNAEY